MIVLTAKINNSFDNFKHSFLAFYFQILTAPPCLFEFTFLSHSTDVEKAKEALAFHRGITEATA